MAAVLCAFGHSSRHSNQRRHLNTTIYASFIFHGSCPCRLIDAPKDEYVDTRSLSNHGFQIFNLLCENANLFDKNIALLRVMMRVISEKLT